VETVLDSKAMNISPSRASRGEGGGHFRKGAKEGQRNKGERGKNFPSYGGKNKQYYAGGGSTGEKEGERVIHKEG